MESFIYQVKINSWNTLSIHKIYILILDCSYSTLVMFGTKFLVPALSGCHPHTPGHCLSTSTVFGFKKMVRRDKLRRQCVADHADERLRLRAILKNKLLPEVVQDKARNELSGQPRDASVTRIRSRCVLTGRGRGVLREYRLCRMKFRELADYGHISGLTRSSW